MVFQDLSEVSRLSRDPELKVPAVNDRMIAVMIDIVLFIPIFTILLSELFKKLQVRYYLDSAGSKEFAVLLLVSVAFVLVITVLLQTIFLIYFRATPGKYLMKMQVVDFQRPQARVSVTQAFLRSSLWAVEWLFVGIPFIEVLSDPLRRPLHDRAAETMVVTLKIEGDRGPQILETRVVRQFLLAVSFFALLWGILLVGEFYKKAVQGEFKKAELVANNNLCESVTAAVADGPRMDRAMALFLAGEVTEECLKQEADFALWSALEESKAMAYLAKMLSAKGDVQTNQQYLERICQPGADTEPCEIAKSLSEESPELNPKWKSESGKILLLITELRSGKYPQVVADIAYFSKLAGYQEYLQKIRVKTLWSMNEHEKAIGAYEVAREVLSSGNRLDLSSWVCQEELDEDCSPDIRSTSCRDVISQVATLSQRLPVETALAILQERECRGSSDSERVLFSGTYAAYPELQELAQALAKDSVHTRATRLEKFKDLASNDQLRPAIREKALLGWVSVANKTNELQGALDLWKKNQNQSWSWVKVGSKILKKSMELKSWASGVEVADALGTPLAKQYGLETVRATLYYQAGESKKAWLIVKDLLSTTRSPANADDFEFIKKDLNKKFGKGL